jgi:hypothetical protein
MESFTILIRRPCLRRTLAGAALVLLCVFGAAACDSNYGSSSSANAGSVNLEVRVRNATPEPVAGAVVTVHAGTVRREATTNTNGTALFRDLTTGDLSVSVSADGFESRGFPLVQLEPGMHTVDISLTAHGAWAVGRAIVLGTRMVEREADGSAMTFSVDIAVISSEDAEALQTLTAADFSIVTIDCGWGGPRDCASDAAGNETGSFWADGMAQSFALQPPSDRRPYLVSVLAERSTAVNDWNLRAPALKSFFAAVGGNDAVSLASIQTEHSAATLTVLGPFTNDGHAYLGAIDDLAKPAGSAPNFQEGLLESIRRAAAASAHEFPGADPTVLVLATVWMSIEEIDEAAALARQLGVRISTIDWGTYGLPETAVRSGGFFAQFDDPRQLAMIFSAADRILGGTLPFYRMQFRLKGRAQTFVAGGNAKVRLKVAVPASIPNRGVLTTLDVAIL